MNNRSWIRWLQGTLIALVVLAGGSTLGWIIISKAKPNASTANTEKSVDTKNQIATAEITHTQQPKPQLLKTSQQGTVNDFTYNVPTSLQGKLISEAQLNNHEKVIALTFDDGPEANSTNKILDILKENHVNATFFVIGEELKRFPELAKRAVDEGNAIGNHTWHHWYRHFDQKGAEFEIDGTSDLIYKDTGVKTSLFRPPGGILNNGPASYARSKKYAVIMWSADTEDYRRPSPAVIIKRAEKEVKPGGILLMHDGGGDRSHTIAALPKIITYFQKQGYKFVTIPQLLEMQDQAKQLITAKK